MKIPLTVLLLICALLARATDFTVTSNGDSGPGTLRDAILQANANAAGAPNRIVFNIADQSAARRTIQLLSSLPALSSSLTVDATTQPGGSFGPTNARVILTNIYTWQYGSYFNIQSVQDVQVFGFWLQGIAGGSAFHFKSSKSLRFGMPGKGNIITGFTIAFSCDNNLSETVSSDVTIQNNFMGTDENGMVAMLNGIDLYIENTANLQIGGLNPGEGNLMAEQSYPAEIKYTRRDDFGFLHIEGNLQGTDITGNTRLSRNHDSWQIDGYNDGNGSKVTGITLVIINIRGNVGVGGFSFFSIASPFTIQGNHLGVGLDNTTNLIAGAGSGISSLLNFDWCTGGLIGGPNPGDKNYLAYNETGVSEFWSSSITVSNNSIFCNIVGIAVFWYVPGRPAPFVGINLLTSGLVGGTSLPGAVIELFYDDECPGCEGKTYIGTTTADNNGNWSYSLAATGAIVATATDTYGATSPFSQATINTNSLVIKNATCGAKNGSIKNIEVTSGTEWYWKDAQGNIVANSTDLTNVGPGTYTFVTSIGGATCNASSIPYTISNINLPAFDPTAIAMTQPTCGQDNGVLKYAGTFNTSTLYSWQRAGITVSPDYSTANPFKNLAPGDYTLQLALKTDPTCAAQYGPFSLVNQSGPTLAAGHISIINPTCGKNNGGLTGIVYQNAMAPVYIAWQDAAGKTVGNTMDLTGVVAGNYRLVFKDAGGCDTIFGSWFPLIDQGSITIDTSNMIKTPASCALANGAVTGIRSTGATGYTWKDVNTGNSAGNAASLTQASAGSYQLTMTNGLGCEASTRPITIAQIPRPAFNYSALQLINDTCNAHVAAIRGVSTLDKSLNYTWAWYQVDANGNPAGAPVSMGAGDLNGINTGNYQAVITDPSGCSTTSKLFTVTNTEANLATPQANDQFIPRNTSTVIKVNKPQTGTYKLLDSDSPNALVLDAGPAGILQTPVLSGDETFYVLFTRGDCSSSLAPVNIKVFDSTRIFVPNVFSPNGDGINDRWHIVVQGLTQNIHIVVFDRWGVKVFSSNDPAITWDGRFHGQLISGSFIYMIDGTDYYNRPFKLKGTIVVLR